MNSASQLQKIGAALGVEGTTADIYVSILAHTELSSGQISILLGIPENEIEKRIEILVKNNLIYSVKQADETSAYQFSGLAKLAKLVDSHTDVFKYLEQLVPANLRLAQRLGIVKYEGIDGIRRVYLEVLEEARRTGQPILAFEKGADAERLGEVFLDSYVKKRIKSNIEAYVISPDALEDQEYKKEHEGPLTHVKIIPSFDIKASINVVGDLVMSFGIDPPQGTLRRDSGEAATLKALFYHLWQ